jgi:membrane protease YdiL (CAAX protease family)
VLRVTARYPIASFTTLALSISWAIWAPLFFATDVSPRHSMLLYYSGVVGPAIAALLCSPPAEFVQRLTRWRVPVAWYAAAIILPCAIRAAALAIDGVTLESRPVSSIVRTTGLMLLLVPFEEIGWRGFLLPALQRRRSPLAASLWIGLLWAAWHAPLAWAAVGYQQSSRPWHYMLWFTLSILPVSCLATWLLNHSDGSIVPVVLFHIAVNVADFAVVLPAAQGQAALVATTILTSLVAAVVWWRDPALGLRPEGIGRD